MTQLTQNTTDLQSILDAVNALPEAGPSVSGEIAITANGTYDVTKYASANVNVPPEAPVLLWTNASPTSAFAAQTVSVASGYDGYIIEAYHTSTIGASSGVGYVYSPITSVTGLQAIKNADGPDEVVRFFTPNANNIVFAGGRYAGLGTERNQLAVPIRIWGVKFTL